MTYATPTIVLPLTPEHREELTPLGTVTSVPDAAPSLGWREAMTDERPPDWTGGIPVHEIKMPVGRSSGTRPLSRRRPVRL